MKNISLFVLLIIYSLPTMSQSSPLKKGHWIYPYLHIQVPFNQQIQPDVPAEIVKSGKAPKSWVILGKYNGERFAEYSFMLATDRYQQMDLFVITQSKTGYKILPDWFFLKTPNEILSDADRHTIYDELYRDAFSRLSQLMGGIEKINEIAKAKYTYASPLKTGEDEINLLSKYGVVVDHYCIVHTYGTNSECLRKQ
jgi:hypothetical protein